MIICFIPTNIYVVRENCFMFWGNLCLTHEEGTAAKRLFMGGGVYTVFGIIYLEVDIRIIIIMVLVFDVCRLLHFYVL